MASTTQRSLAKLRADGYELLEVTERFNFFTKRKNDLFGFGDILAVRGNELLIVQTTSGDHVAHRLEKISGLWAAHVWLQSPNRRIVVHGWAKRGERGKAKRWNCREVELKPGELAPVRDTIKPQKKQRSMKTLPLFSSKELAQ